ncbi:saccharopine dehydrogenase NADP-binding domain-containing protein [Streptomyces cocklensis]|jgi:saccharopine dehydrogenase (NAD+, L-lysine-forming)|uniref:Saccharopine dehydrogenase (NAD+, L-lysine forming) n=1 Tax=Actinacidiphila cocklensis TaxID=887465 RepID=A0A9W4DU67_9ACTN|nr:saccharopine dehydrogenase NADP-binding domain-containing protein [Actinacidiphila cocklensis]MDD1061721.1 saccharopine dehydrogenase NADP-binding domain-containing protein [Actinacidiphila cocklensis]WSX75976.1 saccharopine dehydrogenase NADP-binding domain-containing protein [Streptomyces sp. NBC_00899]CAG6396320.1 Saccharopine dehydrogenase (NAD+, L-lysine forming) [Actinacidiphila cocklensis]
MTWLLYGATGYTGRLIARRAVALGMRPVLAGRSAAKVVPLAAELGLEHRVFGLQEPDAIRRGLDGVDSVAHCAGPFVRTALPMAAACMETGTDYLDITGEIEVFESLHALGGRAASAGVTLLPGAGFDVVPTDCVAALLAARLPDATQLDLAFVTRSGASPGTVRTAVESAAEGGRIRSGGEIRTVPFGSRQVRAAFPSGARTVVSVPWGDVSTAYHSTGIPDITTYTAVPAPALAMTRVMRLGPLRGAVGGALGRLVRGPGERALNGAGCEVWGRARDAAGNSVSATLTGPNPYRMTVDSVLRIVGRLPELPAGFQTPSRALGADFAGSLDGVTVTMAALR